MVSALSVTTGSSFASVFLVAAFTVVFFVAAFTVVFFAAGFAVFFAGLLSSKDVSPTISFVMVMQLYRLEILHLYKSKL